MSGQYFGCSAAFSGTPNLEKAAHLR